MKELKLAYSKVLPPKGYLAITLFGYLIRREEYKDKPISQRTWIHENIHHYQAYDFGIGFCGYFIFYILYGLEWLWKWPCVLFRYRPYRSLSFEQEAYNNQYDQNYLSNRKRFAWAKYIFKFIKK